MTLPANFRDRVIASLQDHERRAYRGLEPGATFDPREPSKDTLSIYLRDALKVPFERVQVKSVTPATGWHVTNEHEVVYVTQDGRERKLSRATFVACFSVVVPTRYDRILEDGGELWV